jgi:hypothetical protein
MCVIVVNLVYHAFGCQYENTHIARYISLQFIINYNKTEKFKGIINIAIRSKKYNRIQKPY